MNPCPCGYLGDEHETCRCTPDAVRRYQGRISGPLLDRLDIRIDVSRPPPTLLLDPASPAEDSATVAERVLRARRRQVDRGVMNARMEAGGLMAAVRPDRAALRLLEEAAGRFHLSARACHRVLKVARTIADLAGEDAIGHAAASEALLLRPGVQIAKMAGCPTGRHAV